MVRFHTLGAVDLRDSGAREILSVLAQPKRLALLAYLAVSPRGSFHRRDTLVGLFWPESDQKHARDSLRQAVRHLRRSLGEGVLVGRGDEELGIDPALLWCDASAFGEALAAGDAERALELDRGELLPGFFLADAPEFEHWLERERARLRAQAGAAAWTAAERREGANDLTAALRFARRAAELERDDEGALRRLIALLARLGDRAGAVRAYEEFAGRLAQECGVEPSPQTKALLDEVRASAVHADAASVRGAELRPALTEAAVHDAASEGPAEQPGRTRRAGPPAMRSRAAGLRGAWLAFAAVVLLAIVVIGAVATGAVGDLNDPNRVVIVPFENRTGEQSLDDLGRWAADWVGQGLAQTGRLQVVDAGVGARYDAAASRSGTDLGEILSGARVGTVVSGAYYRHGDSLQFQVRITDADGDAVGPAIELVSARWIEPQLAVRTLADRVTGAVAAYLDPWHRAVNSNGSQPPSFEAYQAWIDGVEQYNRRAYRDSQALLLHAASLDSSFVTPLIWAAATHGRLGELAAADSLLQIAQSKRNRLLPFDRHFLDRWRAVLRGDRVGEYLAARRMMEVAPASELALYLVGSTAIALNLPAEAVEVLRRIHVERSVVGWDGYGTGLTDAYHLLGKYRAEVEEVRRARERHPEVLRPIVDEVRVLAALGRVEEAIQLLDHALALPPQSGETPAGVARTAADELRAHGHPEAAGRALARALAWYETRPPEERAGEAHRYGVAQVLYRAGRLDEAERQFRELAEEFPEELDYLGYLGAVAARRGWAHEAQRISTSLARSERHYLRGANTYWRARIAAAAGRQDEAIALLRASFAQGQPYGLAVHAEPDFESLRGHPAFQRLLEPKR